MFIDKLKNTLNNEFNYSTTENGALGFRETGKKLLDLNFSVASLRASSEKTIKSSFFNAFSETPELAIKWLFYARDVREGLGERRLFRTVIKDLTVTDEKLVNYLVKFIPEFGRFDDLMVLLNTSVEKTVLNLIATQLDEDLKNLEENKSISLLAKWMPSINTSSKETRKIANDLANKLNVSKYEYRKTLSKLRKYLDVVEVKMTNREWKAIDYSAVPSQANMRYNGAFLRNDEERRRKFLEKVSSGEEKINASVLFPHDIVSKYNRAYKYDETLEQLWKALPNKVEENLNTIVVADGSGSMTSHIGNTSISALDVANALAIYFAEKLKGEFKDKYITFSSRPQLVDFSKCDTLQKKLILARNYDEVSNTNIEAVFNLILTTAVKNKMSQNEIPQNILIISDMEFDSAADGRRLNERLFETIARNYSEYGYKLPRLVFWNVSSRTKTIPVIENDLGVALVSGFSTNIAKMVMSNETDPFKALTKVLNSERYKDIKLV